MLLHLLVYLSLPFLSNLAVMFCKCSICIALPILHFALCISFRITLSTRCLAFPFDSFGLPVAICRVRG